MIDRYVLHELISAIYAGAPDRSSGRRQQNTQIESNGISSIPIHKLTEKQTA